MLDMTGARGHTEIVLQRRREGSQRGPQRAHVGRALGVTRPTEVRWQEQF